MTRASFRLFRTGLIGSIIVALAAGGHLAGGGRLPEPAIVTALCAVAMVPVAVLTRVRLSFPALAGLLGAGQLWLPLPRRCPSLPWRFRRPTWAEPCSPHTRLRRSARHFCSHAASGPCPHLL